MKSLNLLFFALLTPFVVLGQSEAYVEQLGDRNEAEFTQQGIVSGGAYQWGNQNYISVMQEGSFQTYTSLFQQGDHNFALTRQIGNDQFSFASQIGDGNASYQYQYGQGQNTSLLQRGNNNYSYQSQSGGPLNRIETNQFADGSTVFASQFGYTNYSEIYQGSEVQSSRIDQYMDGAVNTAYASQFEGANQHISQSQYGTFNVTSIQQYGDLQSIYSYQVGDMNRSAAEQQGEENFGSIAQWGNGNFASANQYGTNNYLTLIQEGENHSAGIFQIGSGNIANIEQHNSGNSVQFTQSGNNNSLSIYQN